MAEEQVFVDAFLTTRKRIIVISVLCFALAALGGVIAYQDPEQSTSGIILAAAFGALGIGLLAMVFLRDPGKHPAVQTLRDRAADVVWVYEQRTLVNGIHSNTVFRLGLSDGKRVEALVVAAWETRCREALNRACRNATFGYSDELEARFKRDPQSLRAQP